MGYDKNDKIERYSNSDFETLRSAIKMVIDTRAAATGLGSSDFSLYTLPVSLSTAITATNQSVNTIIPTSPFANGLQVMQDLLKKGYMKPDGTSAQINAAQHIKNLDNINQYSIIPALSDFYTVSNYWNLGNSETLHNGCNGACVGYCTGSCANESTVGPNQSDQSSGSTCTDCVDTCTGDNGGCSGSCYGKCDRACVQTCIASCGIGCGKSSCTTNCTNNCGDCSSNCKTTCDIGCGSGCSGACTGNNTGKLASV